MAGRVRLSFTCSDDIWTKSLYCHLLTWLRKRCSEVTMLFGLLLTQHRLDLQV